MRMMAGLEIPRLLTANVSPQPTSSPLAPRSTYKRKNFINLSISIPAPKNFSKSAKYLRE